MINDERKEDNDHFDESVELNDAQIKVSLLSESNIYLVIGCHYLINAMLFINISRSPRRRCPVIW